MVRVRAELWKRSPEMESLETRTLLSVQVTPSPSFGPLSIDTNTAQVTSLLVRYRPDAVLTTAGSDAADLGEPLGLVSGLRKVALKPGQDLQTALKSYQSDPRVLYAEPNYKVHLLDSLTPNDPGYTSGQQWALNNTGQNSGTADADIDAPEAWSFDTGSGKTIVAVIDTGVDYNHPDLVDNMWVNPGEIAGNGIDDDGDGYVDDVHGYDFVNHDGDPMDDNGHGTHVAGTIGARGNNATGVVGVNWKVQIMALKFLGADGNGDSSDAIEALAYAVKMGAKISNNSYGGDGFEQAFADALTSAAKAGHIFVTAAGNAGQNLDTTPSYPASYNVANVVAVAATDRNDQRASWSNYGATTVDLGAPGVTIYSTMRNNSYGSMSGTSMASPHVAGAIALVWDDHPTWTYSQVIDRIMKTVDPISSMAGKTVSGGRLNVRRAIDTFSPTADIVDVTPDPRPDAVSSITVKFSEPVTGFDLADLKLSRDGGSNLLTSQQTLSTSDGGQTFTLGNLAGLTGTYGTYTLTLTAAGSGITDEPGNPLAGDTSDSWAVNPVSGAIDFTKVTIQSYGGQDVSGTATVEDTGATLHLKGNTWKRIGFAYTVTANTVLEFDFRSPAKGEVHTIGFDNDNALSEDRGFQLYGTQAWGIRDFANYDSSAPNWVSYKIPVGKYYTGSMIYLFFGNDDDVTNPVAESLFRNVRAYEAPLTGSIDFTKVTIQSYGGQDVSGTATVEDTGATLHLKGNTWKRIGFAYTVTANTVLEFDFRSPAKGEVHTIGFDNDNALSEDRGFQLYGTQAWGIRDFANYDSSAPNWVSYKIPVGKYYTGSMIYLFFGNDDDVTNPVAESLFRNVRVYESTSSPTSITGASAASASVASFSSGTGNGADTRSAIPSGMGPVATLFESSRLNKSAGSSLSVGPLGTGKDLTTIVTRPSRFGALDAARRKPRAGEFMPQ